MGLLVAVDWPLISLKVLLVGLVSFVAWRVRALTVSGAAAMGLIGLTVLLLAGWIWLIPPLAFFASSVLLGRIPDTALDEPEVRTAWQVLANGAVAWAAVLLLVAGDGRNWHAVDSLLIYLGALAAANADTWATEIGVRYGGKPRDIASGRILTVGASGGITGVGTVGAALGAIVIAGLIPWLYPTYSGNWWAMSQIALAGWLGAMTDSFLGSVAQRRYRCRVCGDDTELPEHCGTATSRRSGFLTNNQVNWVCTSVGGITSWAWLRW